MHSGLTQGFQPTSKHSAYGNIHYVEIPRLGN